MFLQSYNSTARDRDTYLYWEMRIVKRYFDLVPYATHRSRCKEILRVAQPVLPSNARFPIYPSLLPSIFLRRNIFRATAHRYTLQALYRLKFSLGAALCEEEKFSAESRRALACAPYKRIYTARQFRKQSGDGRTQGEEKKNGERRLSDRVDKSVGKRFV